MIKGRQLEGAFFESAVKQAEAAGLPHEQLQMCAKLIDKNKYIALHYIFIEFTADDAAEGIEAFAHIGFFSVKVIAAAVGK